MTEAADDLHIRQPSIFLYLKDKRLKPLRVNIYLN